MTEIDYQGAYMTIKLYHDEMLFSEIYLEEITHQPEKEEVVSSKKVLGEFRDYANTKNLLAWKNTYVHEVLSALGFFVKSIPPVRKGYLSTTPALAATGRKRSSGYCERTNYNGGC